MAKAGRCYLASIEAKVMQAARAWCCSSSTCRACRSDAAPLPATLSVEELAARFSMRRMSR
jgi:hypothetical protein